MKSDEYRCRAHECLERAYEVRDPAIRRQFKEAAERWLNMADQVDRFGLQAACCPAEAVEALPMHKLGRNPSPTSGRAVSFG